MTALLPPAAGRILQEMFACCDPDDADPAEIISARAGALFMRYGYAKTNISDIARDCGMSSGNLYRYFRNKQAIGQAVVGRYFALVQADCAAAIAAAVDAEAALVGMIRASAGRIASLLIEAPLIVELSEALCNDGEGEDVIHLHRDWMQAQMAGLVQAGVDAGCFRPMDAEAAARALFLCLRSFWAPPVVVKFGPENARRDLEEALPLLMAGLRAGLK